VEAPEASWAIVCVIVALLETAPPLWLTIAVWLALCVVPFDPFCWLTFAVFERPLWVILQNCTAVGESVCSVHVALFEVPLCMSSQLCVPPLFDEDTTDAVGEHWNTLSLPAWNTRVAAVQVHRLPGQRAPA
jgi:hypothetical protein